MDQIINMFKPVGWTSFDVVRRVKHRWPMERVGHAGTLDPFAEGVLLVCVGRATKQVPSLMLEQKEYVATLQMGLETDTLDISGRILCKKKPCIENLASIIQTAQTFVGVQEQTPPSFSALKQDGQRLYDLARRGEQVQPASRLITIYELEILSFTPPDRLGMRIVCSKGTFIRALVRDLAYALGTVAFARTLVRTRVGRFDLKQTSKIDRPETWAEGTG